MKVYVVVDIGKACYDCHDVYQGVYKTKEEAEASLSGYDKYDRRFFEILEEEL